MNGDLFEEYHVFHPKFITWAEIQGIDRNLLENMEESEIKALVEKSPYFKSTAADTDYLKSGIRNDSKWVDHSISVTINVPEKTTEETVGAVYVKAWESGCKGMTVYREGSREESLFQQMQNQRERKKKPGN